MFVYAAFDPFPAPKGAAVHIAHFAEALAAEYGPISLVTLEPTDAIATVSVPAGVEHVPLPARGKTLIDRVLDFRDHLLHWWGRRKASVVHVRSIYEGYPLACMKGELCDRLVFEVNGLPSIELKYHYPAVADDRELLAKLEAQEQRCLDAADLVLTPSPVTAAHLVSRGVPPGRLRVIPNGVCPATFPYRRPPPRGQRPLELLYAGTLAAWQGVDRAVEALALIRRDLPARLRCVGPARRRQRQRVLERAADLGVTEAVTLLPPVTLTELVDVHHASDAALVPLLPSDRNLVQGCCPLKALEAMACGVPLIASDLPVMRALVEPEREALLVRPGSPKAMKDAVLRLAADPALADSLSAAGRRRIEEALSWSRAGRELVAAYRELLGDTRSRPVRTADAIST